MWEPNKYIVIKNEDVDRYCTPWYRKVFGWLAKRVSSGRIKDGKAAQNQYLVINLDEPCVKDVVMLLKSSGWSIDGIDS